MPENRLQRNIHDGQSTKILVITTIFLYGSCNIDYIGCSKKKLCDKGTKIQVKLNIPVHQSIDIHGAVILYLNFRRVVKCYTCFL